MRLLDDHDPARLSNTAGTHRCNHLLYGTLAHLDATGRDAPAGFLHPPAMPEQAARKAREGEAARGGSLTPSLPLELSERAVGIAFEVALAREE